MNKEHLTAIILMFIVAALTFSGIVFLAKLPPFKPQYKQIASAARLMIQICIGILGSYSIRGIFRYMKHVNMEQTNYIYIDFPEKEMPGKENKLSEDSRHIKRRRD